MEKILGNYDESNVDNREFLQINFSPTSISLQQRWRNYGLSADFLADYLATFFPAEDEASHERQQEIKNAVSYIANELLENAMKYSYTPSEHSVSIAMYLRPTEIRFYVSNHVAPETLNHFQTFINRLLAEDLDELYTQQLERDTEEQEMGAGLGFLTMSLDYNAELGWKFEYDDSNPDTIVVTTLVRLPV